MAWYVFALVDAVPSRGAFKGLSGVLSFRRLDAAFAVVERRADVPPVVFGTLKKHQEVVSRVAKQVPAILPVRFGTLLEAADLDEAVQERGEEIAEAFDLVRGRVQFTWRLSARRKTENGRGKTGGAGPKPHDGTKSISGAEYLRQAALAANPLPPAAFRALETRLATLAVRQRYQPGNAALPEAVYHLVAASDARTYTAAAADLRATSPQLAMTGPFAPFAFAPEIL